MKPGDHVSWKWGTNTTKGRVVSVHKGPTMLACRDKYVKRNGTKLNPAIVIEHKTGGDVLKLASEVQKLS